MPQLLLNEGELVCHHGYGEVRQHQLCSYFCKYLGVVDEDRTTSFVRANVDSLDLLPNFEFVEGKLSRKFCRRDIVKGEIHLAY